jgi:hypothetical protein
MKTIKTSETNNTTIRNSKGQFEKGNNGKPKGAKNKITQEYKERIEWVLELLDETLEESLNDLKPKEKVELWLNLQEYVRPKLQRMNLDLSPSDDSISKITFEVVRSEVGKEG